MLKLKPSRTLIHFTCAIFFFAPLVVASTGCAPRVTEKMTYDQEDADAIRDQIQKIYAEDE